MISWKRTSGLPVFLLLLLAAPACGPSSAPGGPATGQEATGVGSPDPATAPEPARVPVEEEFAALLEELQGFVGVQRHGEIIRRLQRLASRRPDLAANAYLELEPEGPYVADNLLDVLSAARGEATRAPLLAALGNETSFVRVKATQVLAGRDPFPEARGPLLANLAHERAQQKEKLSLLAALSLHAHEDTAKGVAALLDREQDTQVIVRALTTVGTLGFRSVEPSVRKHTTSSEPLVRTESWKALLRLGFDDAMGPISEGLRGEDGETLRLCLQVVQELGLAERFEDVSALLTREDPELRLFAIAVIGKLDHPDTIRELRRHFGDAEQLVRRAAVLSAAERGDDGAITLLRDLAERKDEEGRWALMVLGRLRDAESVPRMIESLKKATDLEEKRRYIRILVRTRRPEAIPVLLDTLLELAGGDPAEQQLAVDTGRYLANFREDALAPLRAAYVACEDPAIRGILLLGFHFTGSAEAVSTLRGLREPTKDPELRQRIDELVKSLELSLP